MYFPNLLELLFLHVLLFPKASKIGFVANILSPIVIWPGIAPPQRSTKKAIINLLFSVLPAPDSPDITIACFLLLKNSCF